MELLLLISCCFVVLSLVDGFLSSTTRLSSRAITTGTNSNSYSSSYSNSLSYSNSYGNSNSVLKYGQLLPMKSLIKSSYGTIYDEDVEVRTESTASLQ